MNDVVIGAWRNGLTLAQAGDLQAIEKRLEQGFRLLPNENTVVELSQMLDRYDEFAEEILTDPRTLIEMLPVQERPSFSVDYGEYADGVSAAGHAIADQMALDLLSGFAPSDNYSKERKAKTKP